MKGGGYLKFEVKYPINKPTFKTVLKYTYITLLSFLQYIVYMSKCYIYTSFFHGSLAGV